MKVYVPYFVGVALGITGGLSIAAVNDSQPTPATTTTHATTTVDTHISNGFFKISTNSSDTYCILSVDTATTSYCVFNIGQARTLPHSLVPTSTDALDGGRTVVSVPYTSKELCDVMGLCTEVLKPLGRDLLYLGNTIKQ